VAVSCTRRLALDPCKLAPRNAIGTGVCRNRRPPRDSECVGACVSVLGAGEWPTKESCFENLLKRLW